MGNKNAAGPHNGADSPMDEDVRSGVMAYLKEHSNHSEEKIAEITSHMVKGKRLSMNNLIDDLGISPGQAKMLREARAKEAGKHSAPGKTQTQSERVGAFLKQTFIS